MRGRDGGCALDDSVRRDARADVGVGPSGGGRLARAGKASEAPKETAPTPPTSNTRGGAHIVLGRLHMDQHLSVPVIDLERAHGHPSDEAPARPQCRCGTDRTSRAASPDREQSLAGAYYLLWGARPCPRAYHSGASTARSSSTNARTARPCGRTSSDRAGNGVPRSRGQLMPERPTSSDGYAASARAG